MIRAALLAPEPDPEYAALIAADESGAMWAEVVADMLQKWENVEEGPSAATA